MVADKFYIVLSGSVMVLVKDQESKSDPGFKFKKLYLHNPFFYNSDTLLFKHKIINNLGIGRVFGEVGILTGQVRMASIIANENTQLGIMDISTFKEIIYDTVQSGFQEKLSYFKQLFKSNYTKEELYKISTYFQEGFCDPGDYLF